MEKNKKLIIGVIIICIIIAIISPFIASNNPDGLEKTAEELNISETNPVISSPMSDYSIGDLGTIGEITALAIGIIIILLIGLLVGYIIKKH